MDDEGDAGMGGSRRSGCGEGLVGMAAAAPVGAVGQVQGGGRACVGRIGEGDWTWHIAMSPMVPLYWRAAPAQRGRPRPRSRPRSGPRAGVLLPGRGRGRAAVVSSIARHRRRAGQQVRIRCGPGCPAPPRSSSSCNPRVPSGSRPMHGRGGSPAGRSTKRPGPSDPPGERNARHDHAGPSGCRRMLPQTADTHRSEREEKRRKKLSRCRSRRSYRRRVTAWCRLARIGAICAPVRLADARTPVASSGRDHRG